MSKLNNGKTSESNSIALQNTRSNSNKNDNDDDDEDDEFQKWVDELQDEDEPNIKLEIGEYMGDIGMFIIGLHL